VTAPRIPGYRHVEHLGSGGFADVFLYEQEWPHQRVAIKVVRPDVPLTDREKSLFTIEANAMALLADHPYIVSVITAGTTEDGRPYLVMRFCPPPDLGVRVRSNPMGVAEAVSTGIKLASAIETAHRSGILHRDIKPSNVLVTTYSEPAITDFGIAGGMAEVEGDPDVRISYPWSAPEMLDGRSSGSVASDVYSLGATIWHLLVGRSPFSMPGADNSTQALASRILHAHPPATHRPDAPPALDRLLQQCLAKQPAHRPQSALELARGLQRIESAAGFPRTAIAVEGDLSTQGGDRWGAAEEDATRLKPPTISGSAPPPAEQTGGASEAENTADRAPGPPGTGFGLWAVIAVVLLAGVGVLMFLLPRDGGDRDPGVNPSLTASSTPNGPAADAPSDPPTITGQRDGGRVAFTWTAGGATEPGDTWQWLRTDTAQGDRTDALGVRFRAPERVCVQVRQIRGQFVSPWAEECVA
jgi:Protein kinase domain